MTNTLLKNILPSYVILACRNSTPQDREAVMVVGGEPQILLEAFTYNENDESFQIQNALERRYPDANFVCLSPFIMLRLFSALKLSKDGYAIHADVFGNRIKAQPSLDQLMSGMLSGEPLFKILMAKAAYEMRLDTVKNLVKQFRDEAKETNFTVLPDVVETCLDGILAYLGGGSDPSSPVEEEIV